MENSVTKKKTRYQRGVSLRNAVVLNNFPAVLFFVFFSFLFFIFFLILFFFFNGENEKANEPWRGRAGKLALNFFFFYFVFFFVRNEDGRLFFYSFPMHNQMELESKRSNNSSSNNNKSSSFGETWHAAIRKGTCLMKRPNKNKKRPTVKYRKISKW